MSALSEQRPRCIPPRAVVAPQTHVIVDRGRKLAFLPVIDPLPVCALQTIFVPRGRRNDHG